MPFVTTDQSYELVNLFPNDTVRLSITPLGNSVCGNGPTETVECVSLACPEFTVDFSGTDTLVCLVPGLLPLPLEATVSGGSGINPRQRWSGPGVLGTTFDASSLGPGRYLLTLEYEEKGPCGVIDSLVVRVLPTPEGLFSISDDTVCVGSLVEVSYQGTALAGATYNWDFGAAVAVGGNEEGPYQLSFPGAGSFPLSLDVTADGCESRLFFGTARDTVVVIAPLAAPVLDCGPPTRNSVVFQWVPVAGAQGYVLQTPTGTLFVGAAETSYTLSGLNPGDTVLLAAGALGPAPCGDGPLASHLCTSEACPAVVLDLSENPGQICLGPSTQPLALRVRVGGTVIDSSNAVLVWSGPGVNGSFFDPRVAGLGRHELRLRYSEVGPCVTEAFMVLEVFEEPVAAY
ncbi:MAG: hypothetical protein HC821_03565, partial [Lewinella sp.]|nr:hypothetical protein [Lewinella sp.]